MLIKEEEILAQVWSLGFKIQSVSMIFFFLRGLLLIKVGKLFSKLLLTGKIAFSCLDAQIESKAKSQWSELIIYRCKNTLLIA